MASLLDIQADVSALSGKVDALIAKPPVTVISDTLSASNQAAVDAIDASVQAVSAKVDAALAPAPAA